MIRKLEYATLVVKQDSLYTIKLYLITYNCGTLCMISNKWRNLKKNWDLFSIKMVVNVLTKPDRVQNLNNLISNNKKVYDIVQVIYI